MNKNIITVKNKDCKTIEIDITQDTKLEEWINAIRAILFWCGFRVAVINDEYSSKEKEEK